MGTGECRLSDDVKGGLPEAPVVPGRAEHHTKGKY
jgi:hypothetical protein